MKRLYIIFVILVLCQMYYSQTGTIKGHIYDNIENEGLAFASVFIVGQKQGTSTNLDGNFLIDSIPVGSYDLKIAYIGLRDTVITNIVITNNAVVDLYINYPPPCPYDSDIKLCPVCKKKDKVIPIVYGLPGNKLMSLANKGKVWLGGCVISGCDPSNYCKRDKKSF